MILSIFIALFVAMNRNFPRIPGDFEETFDLQMEQFGWQNVDLFDESEDFIHGKITGNGQPKEPVGNFEFTFYLTEF